ncbi:MAG: CCA tRNA nucleotidyltransferase [Rickettsia endosymbiont of Ixodes persulcatus]|nr:CCA tRNA nucleotidyltransferase [Rickettsia endosymbiont of Ixodes persulcatus]MCZ6903047.1 CCA tRNA nucleotidyltransferase [Rickettsia endosymbiont of Ixodes persulcatus]MCZ6909514.1 CCA tRNA nucleotidyltransferase [Rickettsia endosymbiont of Ixodes persulcatus]MCZ6909911.1 CCA tRNA nucleotidyltransferase [Rickettsia endosymbiont of Ixodes persulcatus]MCZ6913401.1 CCA tRNA nucleotidyltransferase [Rickettsia endosymbiont of Ixodes persulcatus]
MQIIQKTLKISSKGYKKILSLLNEKGQSRLIGGCVRDALLKKDSYDIDIATTLIPSEVMNILSRAKIKTILTGLKFGTITAILDKEKFEITTLRKDIECNGRHAKLVFTNDFAEDTERRDFTINALSYCPFKNEIYDYFDGVKDLQQEKVVFIGEALDRIKEDYLRILRFFRFSSHYANQLDNEGLKACKALKYGLKTLSRERIKSEMNKIIVSKRSAQILEAMFEIGILELIFSIQNYKIKFFEQANDFKLELATRYALLLYNQKDLNLKVFLDWKFSKHEAMQILSIMHFLNDAEFNMKKIWLEKKNYKEYLLAASIIGKLDYLQVKEFIRKYDTVLRPKFQVNGNDLLNMNIEKKEIGAKLEYLKNFWIEQDFKPSKLELLRVMSFPRKRESSSQKE